MTYELDIIERAARDETIRALLRGTVLQHPITPTIRQALVDELRRLGGHVQPRGHDQ